MLFDTIDFPLDAPRSVSVAGSSHQLKPCQTVTWISVLPGAQYLPGDFTEAESLSQQPRLPAIIDTGYTGTVALTEAHLDLLALSVGDRRFFPDKPRWIRASGSEPFVLPVLLADLWLRSEDGAKAHRIALGQFGMELYLADRPLIQEHIDFGWWERNGSPELSHRPGPPLPLIGLRALTFGRVRVDFHCDVDNVRVGLHV